MEQQRQKIIFIVTLAILIVIGSFYSFWQKRSVIDSTSSGEVLAKNTKVAEEKTTEIVVYISGAVNKPGVFKLSNHGRVVDLVTLAGGLSMEADPSKINMAQQLKDGMHVNVAAKVLIPQGTGDALGNSSRVKISSKVNINTADKIELDTLPGVGPALAEQIMEYRQVKGSFNDVDELKKVPGIGPSKFEKMKEKITI
ncbi:MAG: ComEA family DNA-binding protein [Sporomusaceae bacterium]|nr:ComEA family DNA-binding protein [Sporomusaceae bacterium]